MYNVSIPDDAFSYGEANTLCTPHVSWATIAAFYIGNYVAHSATVHTYPGEATQSMIRAAIFALLFPTAGIARGLNAIFRRARLQKTDLQTAARAGALCMVVRSKRWRPLGWPRDRPLQVVEGEWVKELPRWWPYFDTSLERPEPERVPVQQSDASQHDAPENGTVLDSTAQDGAAQNGPSHPTLPQTVPPPKEQERQMRKGSEQDGWWRRLLSGASSRKIQGTCILDEAFELAFVPRHAVVEPLPSSASAAPNLPTSSTTIKSVIAIGQAGYAASTLYYAGRDQAHVYGYAAFGLTVAPYVIMSLINLFGNFATPAYPALYLVESEISDEALERAKNDGSTTRLSGQVGRLKPREQRGGDLIFIPVRDEEMAVDGSDSQRLRARDRLRGSPRTQLEVVQLGTLLAQTSSDAGVPVTASIGAQRTRQVATRVAQSDGPQAQSSMPTAAPPAAATHGNRWVEQWTHPPFERSDAVHGHRLNARNAFERDPIRGTGISLKVYSFFILTTLFVGCLPIAVVGAASRFDGHSSTTLQRGFTMAWLASGIIVGVAMAIFSGWIEFRSHGEAPSSDAAKVGLMIAGLVLFAAPAIGGFVVVGQMMKTFGTCVKW